MAHFLFFLQNCLFQSLFANSTRFHVTSNPNEIIQMGLVNPDLHCSSSSLLIVFIAIKVHLNDAPVAWPEVFKTNYPRL